MTSQLVQNKRAFVDAQRLAGRMQWLGQLLAQGDIARATAYAAKHSLTMPGGAGVDGVSGPVKPNQSPHPQIFPPKGLTEFSPAETPISEPIAGVAMVEAKLAPISPKQALYALADAPPIDPEAKLEVTDAPWAYQGHVDTVPEVPPPFVPPLDPVPMGVRWARVIREPHNRLMKVIRFLDGGNEALCWVRMRDYPKGADSMQGQQIKVVPNTDTLQGGWAIWRG